jgi:hypothetical protein
LARILKTFDVMSFAMVVVEVVVVVVVVIAGKVVAP